MKYYLLFDHSGWDCGFSVHSLESLCIVKANSPEEVARKIGGFYHEYVYNEFKPSVRIPKNRFIPMEESEYFREGEFLEFVFGCLRVEISSDDDAGYVNIVEVPFLGLDIGEKEE